MIINIFIFCYNEEVLITHTLKFYKTNFPSANIIILDNYSNDNSLSIAKQFGCEISYWGPKDKLDVDAATNVRNNIWKSQPKGWNIVIDMDEFLCINEDELCKEDQLGTTILSVNGIDIIGESQFEDLRDISLCDLKKYKLNYMESKNVCFNSLYIQEMNFTAGGHDCFPIGKPIFSKKIYNLKHMNALGIPYLLNRFSMFYERGLKNGKTYHYSNNPDKVIERYNQTMSNYLLEK